MLLKYLPLLFTLSLAAAPVIDHSFSIDLSALNYPLITADPQANIVIAGFVRSCSLPVVAPISSCGPLWIGKLDPTGQKLVFATYLGDSTTAIGGFASTSGFGLQTDPNGNIVMVSSVTKAGLPTVNPIQPGVNGNSSLYIFKLSAGGTHLIYATYLGGSNYEVPVSLALDLTGAAYILDSTNSSDFPTTPNAVNSNVFGRSAIVKLTPDGALGYSASFPWVFTLQPVTVDNTGAVTLVDAEFSRTLKLSADATTLTTSTLPTFANGKYYYPFTFPMADGGLWVTGSAVDGNLPVTPDALEALTGAVPTRALKAELCPFPSASLRTTS